MSKPSIPATEGMVDEDLLDGPDPDGAEVELRQIRITPDQHGMRFDLALSQALKDFSRSFVGQLIADQRVRPLEGLSAFKPSSKVKSGQGFEVEIRPTLQSQAFQAQEMAIETVYVDEHLRVIAKPAGLVVHPAPGNWSGTLLNGLLALDASSWLTPRAGIVHRLDKDTSGLMVIARSRACMDALVGLISKRQVHRQYLALAHRSWQGGARDVDIPIGRDPRQRLRMAVVDLSRHPGKIAQTHVACLARNEDVSLLHCTLSTGRTHQIRVHLSHLGHPLVGDTLYGGKTNADIQRQALHAHKLGFIHPMTGETCEWQLPLPPDIRQAVSALCLSYN